MLRALLLPTILLAAVFAGCLASPSTSTESCTEPGCEEPPVVTPCPDGTTAVAPATCPVVEEPAPVLPWHPSDGAAEVVDALLEGVDDHMVPVTVYRPLVAGPNATVPILLHSHGWAGARTSDPTAFQPFLAAGFGIVSIDMRGHGAASDGSEARVHSMDHEIPDLRRVVDEIATWDWVHLDAPGDPRIGAMGGSYGGGYQLLLAATDPRLDAIAPEITWHDLLGSLAPGGAPKSAWIDLLYYGAHGTGTQLAQEIHEAYGWLQATNKVPDGSLPGQVDIVTPFAASSPGSHAGAIRIPSLFIQGAPDTLFSFNQAVANYHMVGATGVPVALVTHLGGHILHTDGTLPDGGLGVPVGIQPPPGGAPCGAPADLVLAWHERHLIGLDVSVPSVCITLEDGSIRTGSTFPLENTTWTEAALGDATIAVGHRGIPFEAVVLEADEELAVVGAPRLMGTYEAPLDAIVYWTLEKVDASGARHVVLSQVTPMRIEGSSDFSLELEGVAVAMEPGSSLVLVGADRNAQYVHNDSRTPGVVQLTGLKLALPVV